jgi:hypothetical protein
MYDWNNYKKDFPERYIQDGYFDEYLNEIIDEMSDAEISVLDVGGGVEGTKALNRECLKVKLLDPFIDGCPDWMVGTVDWDSDEKFDLVVCRGSINYLSEEQMYILHSMIKPGGILVANTFLEMPPKEWTERPYQTIDGKKGVERFRQKPSEYEWIYSMKIEHELIPENGEPIKHLFNFYKPSRWNNFFNDVLIQKYKSNSAILEYKKRNDSWQRSFAWDYDWSNLETQYANKAKQESELSFRKDVFEKVGPPQDGFEWIWFDDIRCLSGWAGLFEIDFKLRRQGRVVILVRS